MKYQFYFVYNSHLYNSVVELVKSRSFLNDSVLGGRNECGAADDMCWPIKVLLTGDWI